ncbi:MAG: cobalamin biosynthesis protein [Lachnospiraceae bacterium]|nr:cobalamin biosynthesis protein [Lachnospiraceae bacterium]
MATRLAILSFSCKGAALAKTIAAALGEAGDDLSISLATTNERAAVDMDRTTMKGWTADHFYEEDVLIYIGASGIAVRAIAPYLVNKAKDPAVLVIDDAAHFVIALLSGHLGGANAWTNRIAPLIGATPVVTTASDSNKKLAVDVWAQDNALYITDLKMAKVIESAYLDGQPIALLSDEPVEGDIPKGISLVPQPMNAGAELLENEAPGSAISAKETPAGAQANPADAKETPAETIDERPDFGIYVGYDPVKAGFAKSTLHLIPQRIVAGAGCRKGTAKEVIDGALHKAFAMVAVPPEALLAIASIDLKAHEEGLLATADAWQADKKGRAVTTAFYSAAELATIKTTSSSSAFVSSVTGIDNVSERAALYAAERLGKNARLLLEKTIIDGTTAALVRIERSLHFG